MNRLRIGAGLLLAWSGLNLLVAAAVTLLTLAGRDAPVLAMVLDDAGIAALDPRVLGVVNAQAVFANPCVVALCLLVMVLVVRGVRAGIRWAHTALVVALVPLQAFGFASDAFLQHRNLAANVVSSVVLVAGLVLARPVDAGGGRPQGSSGSGGNP